MAATSQTHGVRSFANQAADEISSDGEDEGWAICPPLDGREQGSEKVFEDIL